ncbi:exocyst subunit [Microsporum ferrugineum]
MNTSNASNINDYFTTSHSSGRAHDYDYGASDNGSMNSSVNGYGRPREGRAGGYGGTSYLESPSPGDSMEQLSPQVSMRSRGRDIDDGPSWGGHRDESRFRSSERQRREENARQRSVSRSGRGPEIKGAEEIDGVVQIIEDEWEFMADSECIPVQVGLQLMDTSTLGRADREPEFIQIYQRIQQALRSVVNEHHHGFNSLLGTYHNIQTNLQSSQHQIRALKAALLEAKAGLLTMKPELKDQAIASQSYDEILQLFELIEHAQSLPEQLEARMSDKKFIAAVDILKEGTALLRRPELAGIGSLGDLRTYFSNQETSLTDILVEELHDHLYLKSPYCCDRWKPSSDRDGPSTGGAATASWEKPFYQYLASLDAATPFVEDVSRNPESDTFYYIHLVLEALHKMGNLDVVVDRIEQRLPVELYSVVDKTGAEVNNRHPDIQKGARMPGTVPDPTSERGPLLSEFLWNLYAKFETIAEGHRVLYEVINGIVKRDKLPNEIHLTSSFQELWKLYQSEMRSLLHDYLSTDGAESFRTTTRAADDGYAQSSVKRDKTKKLFKMSEVDQAASDLKAEQDELAEILRASVPGLVPKSRQMFSTSDTNNSNQQSSGTGHKLLIEPSVFNISLLLPPALSFIHRLKEIVPPSSDIVASTLTSFLDEFLINVFQPQLDEAVSELCTINFISVDAYTEDPQWALHSTRPIFRGTINFMNLIKTFSRMLDSIPHDQAFTQLIIDQIVTYYEKCSGWYKALMTRISPNHPGGVALKTSAAFAESKEIREVGRKLWESSEVEKQALINKEIELLITATNETSLKGYDMISDPKIVGSLSLLYNSMNWLSSNLSKLRHITPHQTDSSHTQSRQVAPTRRWTLEASMRPKRGDLERPLRLPMTKESVVGFDGAIKSIQNLGFTAIFTLHLDIRCGSIYMISRALKGKNDGRQPKSDRSSSTGNSWAYILTVEPTSASPIVLELNNDLISFGARMSTYLGPNECRYITSCLARLIDRALVSSSRFIGAMNSYGALRLQLDVLVLQQNLKNIIVVSPTSTSSKSSLSLDKDVSASLPEVVALPQSAKFLDWFLEGPGKTLQHAKEERDTFKEMGIQALREGNGEPFTYDELKVLIELCFSAALKGPQGPESREEFMAAKRGLDDSLLRLSEVMWDV